MADVPIGVPITFCVMERLFPGKGRKYTDFLKNEIGKDDMVKTGVMTGGQQYIESLRA
jgi:hypothetical protein